MSAVPDPVFTLEAPAKLNLRLWVGPPTDGPLHTIVSVIADLALADELRFSPSPGGLRVSCDLPEIAGDANLIWRALQALYGDELPPLLVDVRKRIPLQAGLGGGSADAAAALHGVQRSAIVGRSAPTDEQLREAARLTGSDVAACLVPGLKLVSGYGEAVETRPGPIPEWGIVLVKGAASMPTGRAYALLDEYRGSSPPQASAAFAEREFADRIVNAIHAADFASFCALLRNDFDAPVEAALPVLATLRDRLHASGAQATLLCGSGSCLAGFFETMEDARTAHDRWQLHEGEWKALTSLRR